MAIKIANLEKISQRLVKKDYLFKDLHLDFTAAGNFDSALQRKITGNDIKVSYDESAIRNSLKNLFNTKPGQRFLFPRYGLDLNQFLFEAITADNAKIIGEAIVTAIEKYEPRVRVASVDIIPMYDDNQYDITLIISMPAFNTTASINSILDTKTQTFIFVETSRTK